MILSFLLQLFTLTVNFFIAVLKLMLEFANTLVSSVR